MQIQIEKQKWVEAKVTHVVVHYYSFDGRVKENEAENWIAFQALGERDASRKVRHENTRRGSQLNRETGFRKKKTDGIKNTNTPLRQFLFVNMIHV